MKVASPRRPIFWPGRVLDHISGKHGIELEEIRVVESDPRWKFIRAKKGRYLFIGQGQGGRLISLVVEPHRDHFVGITARLANRTEIRLYRRP